MANATNLTLASGKAAAHKAFQQGWLDRAQYQSCRSRLEEADEGKHKIVRNALHKPASWAHPKPGGWSLGDIKLSLKGTKPLVSGTDVAKQNPTMCVGNIMNSGAPLPQWRPWAQRLVDDSRPSWAEYESDEDLADAVDYGGEVMQ